MGILDKFFKARKRISPEPIEVPSDVVKQAKDKPSRAELVKNIVRKASVYNRTQIASIVSQALAVSYYRRNLYRECDLSTEHAFVSGAINLYVDSVTETSPLTNRSVWIVSEDKKLENILNTFLEEIGIEERLRDWAAQIAIYGDFFIELIGREGLGVVFIDDNIYPGDVERIEINGRLEGFVRTNFFELTSPVTYELEPPWKYVHFRIFGAQKKIINAALGIFGQSGPRVPRYAIQLGMRTDTKYRLTSRYGVSLLVDAVPVYKRLKLAEDSVLLARITRGILYYLYKIKVSGEEGTNFDALMDIVDAYADLLKRKTGLDASMSHKEWRDRWEAIFAQVEDLFVPETDTTSVEVEKLGGEVDIRAVVDIEMLENRLLGALRVSRAMLGLTDQLPGSLGESSLRRISINFAKNADRLQSALKRGIKRLCQIHLAYRGIDPRPDRFEVEMTGVSSAEEEELKSALDKGIDVSSRLMDLIAQAKDSEEKKEILQYLNKKILKLNDLDLDKLLGGSTASQQKERVVDTELFQLLPSTNGKLQKIRLTESRTLDRVLVERQEWQPRKVTFVPEKVKKVG